MEGVEASHCSSCVHADPLSTWQLDQPCLAELPGQPVWHLAKIPAPAPSQAAEKGAFALAGSSKVFHHDI